VQILVKNLPNWQSTEKYPIAYSNQVCAIYYQNVLNSASHRRKPVEIHPFVKTGKEALKLGGVPHEVITDLKEYIKHVEMYTAKHNIEASDRIWLSTF